MYIAGLSSRLRIRVASKQAGKDFDEIELDPSAAEVADYLGTNKESPKTQEPQVLQQLSAIFADSQVRNRLNLEA